MGISDVVCFLFGSCAKRAFGFLMPSQLVHIDVRTSGQILQGAGRLTDVFIAAKTSHPAHQRVQVSRLPFI